MMVELIFIFNGFRKINLGSFDDVKVAITVLKEHVRANSAITKPRYAKSMSEEGIRIDYGACDCYYLIRRGKANVE